MKNINLIMMLIAIVMNKNILVEKKRKHLVKNQKNQKMSTNNKKMLKSLINV